MLAVAGGLGDVMCGLLVGLTLQRGAVPYPDVQ